MPDMPRYLGRGLALSVILGPVTLLAALMAGLCLVGAVTGWGPEFLKTGTPLDFLYGGGGATMFRYFGFVIAGVIASAGWATMRWGYTGDFEL